MREGAKKRLIGAVVIVALAVIFVPMLFEPESLDSLPPIQTSIPRPPAFDQAGKTEVFLGPQDSGVGGIAESAATVSQPLALPPSGASGPVPGGVPGAPNAIPSMPVTKPVKAPAQTPAQPPAKAAATQDAAPPRAAVGLASWVIQVASAASPEGAADLQGKLRAGGFSAFIEKAEVNGKTTYRVLVGPELDRARADQTAARLREKHKVEPLIKSYP